MQSPATTVSGDHWVAEEIGGVHLRGPLVISENGTCNRDRHPLGTNTQGARCVPVSRSFNASIPRVELGLCCTEEYTGDTATETRRLSQPHLGRKV